MGLLSGSKVVSVSSVVYNLAGDEANRVRYLPASVTSKIIFDTQFSMAETIQGALLKGPGIRLRGFARWAQNHGYTDLVEQQESYIVAGSSIDAAAIMDEISDDPDETVNLQTAEIGPAEYSYWADQWLLANHPTRAMENYTVDFNETANIITISMLDAPVVDYTFSPAGFDVAAQYLYVSYTISKEAIEGPVTPGTVNTVATPGELPSTVGWINMGSVITSVPIILHTEVDTLIEYSDGRPDETDHDEFDTPSSWSRTETRYERKFYLGQTGPGDSITSLKEIMFQWNNGFADPEVDVDVTNEDIGGGVIKTTTVTTTTDVIAYSYSWRTDTQTIVEKEWTPMQVLIYQEGTGNPIFDAMFDAPETGGNFFPFVPMRIEGVFLSDSYLPEVYAANKKAIKKAINAKYDDIIEQVEDNDNLGDIDHAYATFGVSLNVKENACRKYIYTYLQTMIQNGLGHLDVYTAWQELWSEAHNGYELWKDWKAAQGDPGNPLYGTDEPLNRAYPQMPRAYARVRSPAYRFDMMVSWQALVEVVGTGLGKPGAKVGEVWFTVGDTEHYNEIIYNLNQTAFNPKNVDFVTLRWQDTATTYRTIGMWGLTHTNTIYKGRAVVIKASEALADVDESGFIIPLHEGIYRQMRLVDATQMSTACCFLVFNCYEVKKAKWYQSALLNFFLIVAIVITSVVSGGTTAGLSGVLGSAASVGAALGFQATIAIIVGSVANAVAAMILSKVLTSASVAIFGDEIGQIIGAIASIVAISVGTGLANGQGMAVSFQQLTAPENLLKFTASVGNSYGQLLEGKTQEFIDATNQLVADYAVQAQNIARAYEHNIGYGTNFADPAQLAAWSSTPTVIPESSTMFFSRTLLTGSDIADMSLNMLTNFSDITLSTELPI